MLWCIYCRKVRKSILFYMKHATANASTLFYTHESGHSATQSSLVRYFWVVVHRPRRDMCCHSSVTQYRWRPCYTRDSIRNKLPLGKLRHTLHTFTGLHKSESRRSDATKWLALPLLKTTTPELCTTCTRPPSVTHRQIQHHNLCNSKTQLIAILER